MKTSNYNVRFNLNNEENIIFNTLTKKYVIFNKNKDQFFTQLLENLDHESFNSEEAEVLKQLYNKGIIINDNINEIDIIKYKERVAMYQDQYFLITIQPTLNCNFRCIYCYENLKDITLNDMSAAKVLNFIKKVSKKVNKLVIHWFGGEPLLEKDYIKYLCKEIKKICDDNRCNYESVLITNGYLLSEEDIEELKILNLKKIQITIDGFKENHDYNRPLFDGSSTFDVIIDNLYKALQHDIFITLRVNISDKNYRDIEKLFQIIEKEKRNKVILSLANVYQNKEKIDLYPLYKRSIEMGYIMGNVFGNPHVCEGAIKNSILIDPVCRVTSCSVAAENDMYFGFIDEDGNIISNKNEKYHKLRNILASEEENCKKCIKLPVCFGGCKLLRSNNNRVCNWANPTGISLHDRIRLQYLNDKRLGIENEYVV